jgi:hypothetical protein
MSVANAIFAMFRRKRDRVLNEIQSLIAGCQTRLGRQYWMHNDLPPLGHFGRLVCRAGAEPAKHHDFTVFLGRDAYLKMEFHYNKQFA